MHDLTFTAFAVCRPPFQREQDIIPVWSQTKKRDYLHPISTDYFFILVAWFNSYVSFIILILHVLFVKLQEFQIRAIKDANFSEHFVQSP